MNYKIAKVFFFILMFIPLISLFGCSDEKENYEDYIKVVYELEGGTYKNSKNAFTHYYKKPETQNSESGSNEILIFEPTAITKKDLVYEKHEFVGWFKTKTVYGEKVEYSDEWDFENDTVSSDTLVLYAKWKSLNNHKFNVCYRDENNNLQSLGKYNVDEGEAFVDYKDYCKKRIGYTFTGNFYTEDGNLIEGEFIHPGGETDLEIVIVCEFIKGTFKICKTAKEFINATSINNNIYLANDIDLEGASISFKDYNKTLIGNGFKVSNFKVKFDSTKSSLKDDISEPTLKSLYISLFGNMKNASVSDISFENVTFEIEIPYTSYINKIYVSPLASILTNTELKNVTLNGTYVLSDDKNVLDKLTFETKKAYILSDTESKIENVNIQIEVKENKENE